MISPGSPIVHIPRLSPLKEQHEKHIGRQENARTIRGDNARHWPLQPSSVVQYSNSHRIDNNKREARMRKFMAEEIIRNTAAKDPLRPYLEAEMYRTEEAVIPLPPRMKKCAWDIDVFEEQRNLAERIRNKKRHNQIVARKRHESVRKSGLSTTWKPFRKLSNRARRKQKSFSLNHHRVFKYRRGNEVTNIVPINMSYWID